MDRLDFRVGDRLHQLRRERGLSLQALADASEVSRSMISLIERGETNPSAAVLARLAETLGIPLARLFRTEDPALDVPVLRIGSQPVWQDPVSGYVRRSLSPPGRRQMLLSEVEMPCGARVNYTNGERLAVVEQQVWVLAGELIMEVGPARHHLSPGDCIAMGLGQTTSFSNPGPVPARYLVAVANV